MSVKESKADYNYVFLIFLNINNSEQIQREQKTHYLAFYTHRVPPGAPVFFTQSKNMQVRWTSYYKVSTDVIVSVSGSLFTCVVYEVQMLKVNNITGAYIKMFFTFLLLVSQTVDYVDIMLANVLHAPLDIHVLCNFRKISQ